MFAKACAAPAVFKREAGLVVWQDKFQIVQSVSRTLSYVPTKAEPLETSERLERFERLERLEPTPRLFAGELLEARLGHARFPSRIAQL